VPPAPPPAPDPVPSLSGPAPAADATLAFPAAAPEEPRRRTPVIVAGAILALLAVGGGGYAAGLAVGHRGRQQVLVPTTGPLGSNTSGTSNTGGGLTGGNKPFTGDVTAVNGSTVTLTDTTSGATVTVELTSRTTVRLVNYGSELDIKPGSTITVQGPRLAGNTFRARVVTVDSGPVP
jgi:hypothetical protein